METALRRVAAVRGEKYPLAAEALRDDTYIDDTFTVQDTVEMRDKARDEMVKLLSEAGFIVKAFAVSGEKPPEKLRTDGKTVGTLGYAWDTLLDECGLGFGEINFSKQI